jgi:RND family efflux transporter MFP subunit
MKKLILVILLILLVAAGIRLVKIRKQAVVDAPLAIPMTHAVKTVLPETKTTVQTSTFLARLDAVRSIETASKLSGRIIELLVSESQQVSKGDLLARIDDQEIRASIAALQAKLLSAKATHDYNKKLHARNQALFAAGGLAKEKLEASEVAYSTTSAVVKELQENIAGLNSQLDYSNLHAPFAGIIGTVFLHQGDLAAPGRALLTLNSLPQKLTFSFIPGAADVQPGQDVLSQGIKLGSISTLYNDAKAGLQVAEVVLQEQITRPSGSYLTIEVVTKQGTGCAVPVQALLHRPEGESVMVYEEEQFHEKSITVIARDAHSALIEPCVNVPVAVASEAKLSILPSSGRIQLLSGENNE